MGVISVHRRASTCIDVHWRALACISVHASACHYHAGTATSTESIYISSRHLSSCGILTSPPPPVVPTVPVELGWVENYVPVLSRLKFNGLPTCSLNARQFNAFMNLRSSSYVRSPLPDTINTHVQPQNASTPSLVSHALANMPLTCLPHPALELAIPHSELNILLNSHRKNRQKSYIYIFEEE
jgi:hypothetical protein